MNVRIANNRYRCLSFPRAMLDASHAKQRMTKDALGLILGIQPGMQLKQQEQENVDGNP